jgi:hypothetical protein
MGVFFPGGSSLFFPFFTMYPLMILFFLARVLFVLVHKLVASPSFLGFGRRALATYGLGETGNTASKERPDGYFFPSW